MSGSPITSRKPMTRLQSVGNFDHILGVLGVDDTSPISLVLEYNEITTLIDFYELDLDDLGKGEYITTQGQLSNLGPKDRRRFISMVKWIKWLGQDPTMDYLNLQYEDYEEFIKGSRPQAPSTPLHSPPQMQIPLSPNVPAIQPPRLVTNVKLDVKQYPTFNGDTASWPRFKRGVISIASTHGLDDIFDVSFNVPTIGDQDYLYYQDKNRFVYSIWVARVTGGLALSIIREFEDDRDGRGVYFKFLSTYESRHNQRQMALLAMNKLSGLQLNYNTTGGVPTFLAKF
jgi:hypothetical protein